jgi:hypothetical protein
VGFSVENDCTTSIQLQFSSKRDTRNTFNIMVQGKQHHEIMIHESEPIDDDAAMQAAIIRSFPWLR